jgi:hypothetical protein
MVTLNKDNFKKNIARIVSISLGVASIIVGVTLYFVYLSQTPNYVLLKDGVDVRKLDNYTEDGSYNPDKFYLHDDVTMDADASSGSTVFTFDIYSMISESNSNYTSFKFNLYFSVLLTEESEEGMIYMGPGVSIKLDNKTISSYSLSYSASYDQEVTLNSDANTLTFTLNTPGYKTDQEKNKQNIATEFAGIRLAFYGIAK